jgi:hypothetical protein
MTSTVPPGRGPLCIATPGTSCLATISLSLRDKSHSPIEAPHNYLSAYGAATLGNMAERKEAAKPSWIVR